jgi:hypothetical protein
LAAALLAGLTAGVLEMLGLSEAAKEITDSLALDARFAESVQKGQEAQQKFALQHQNFQMMSNQMLGTVMEITDALTNGSTASFEQISNLIMAAAMNMDYGLAENLPHIHAQVEEMWNAISTTNDLETVKEIYRANGYEITDALAQSILTGKDEILANVGLLGIDLDTMLKTSIDETSVTLQKSAEDWGRIFGQAIPDGATVGLENGMYVLRAKTGEVIKLVSSVDSAATVSAGNKETAEAGMDALKGGIDGKKTEVETSATDVATAIQTPFDGLPEATKAQAVLVMEGVKTAIDEGSPAATAAVETAANAVVTKASEIMSGTVGSGIGSTFITNIGTGMTSKQEALKTSAGTVGANGVSGISGVMTAAAGQGIGSGMIQSVINGVVSKSSALYGAMRSAALGAVAAFRSALQMRSPSRLLMADGALMPESIGLGVYDNADAAIRSMTDLARDMHDAWPGVDVPGVNVTDNPNSWAYDGRSTGGDRDGFVFNNYAPITVREEEDIHRIAQELYDLYSNDRRGGGF